MTSHSEAEASAYPGRCVWNGAMIRTQLKFKSVHFWQEQMNAASSGRATCPQLLQTYPYTWRFMGRKSSPKTQYGQRTTVSIMAGLAG